METLQRITINTDLNGFLIIDRITHADTQGIGGIKSFTNAPVYLGLESLAQLGAFHVRYLIGFERHAFLLKITQCLMPVQAQLNGTFTLSGRLLNMSSSAFSHKLQAEKGDNVIIEGELMFATVDYDQSFKKEALQDHYRNIFSCLKNGSTAD